MAYQYRTLEDGTREVCGRNGVWRKARITKSEKERRHALCAALEAEMRAEGLL